MILWATASFAIAGRKGTGTFAKAVSIPAAEPCASAFA
jgi:hypothetical protein